MPRDNATRQALRRLLGVGSLAALRRKWTQMPEFNRISALRQVGAA